MTKYNEDGTHYGSSLENAYTTSALRESLGASTLNRSQLNIICNLAIAAQSHFNSVSNYSKAHDVGLLLGLVKDELESK